VQQAKKAKKAAESVKAKKAVKAAIDVAIEEAEKPEAKPKRRRRGAAGPPSEPVNEPLAFIDFVGSHPLGSKVEGEVDEFTSHGAFVLIDSVRCYLPLTAMGDPPPRSARTVMKKGEKRVFTIQAFDPPRRGVEIALPDFVHVAGAPTPETVEAEIAESEKPVKAKKLAPRKERAKAAAKKAPTTVKKPKKAAAKKEPVKKTAATKKATKKLAPREVRAE
jgi:hypothetical protein